MKPRVDSALSVAQRQQSCQDQPISVGPCGWCRWEMKTSVLLKSCNPPKIPSTHLLALPFFHWRVPSCKCDTKETSSLLRKEVCGKEGPVALSDQLGRLSPQHCMVLLERQIFPFRMTIKSNWETVDDNAYIYKSTCFDIFLSYRTLTVCPSRSIYFP